ncbi:hypothetical protein QR98_0072310 [Sarcoptes scabiei]|uniref:Uncharacterized protein n=1 Tax=Sarcoptes scabiei TaxID=52283 RepID=A0A132ACR8_SARSC|nr:hypothetical protein QR98_0072310 [Sarcoptes scabiei]
MYFHWKSIKKDFGFLLALLCCFSQGRGRGSNLFHRTRGSAGSITLAITASGFLKFSHVLPMHLIYKAFFNKPRTCNFYGFYKLLYYFLF